MFLLVSANKLSRCYWKEFDVIFPSFSTVFSPSESKGSRSCHIFQPSLVPPVVLSKMYLKIFFIFIIITVQREKAFSPFVCNSKIAERMILQIHEEKYFSDIEHGKFNPPPQNKHFSNFRIYKSKEL